MEASRIIIGAHDAKQRLTGATIDGAEFVEGETEDEDYLILRLGSVTVYANAPTVYDDAPGMIRAPLSDRDGLAGDEIGGPRSALATLFAEGQRVPELDDDDLSELGDIVAEEFARRGRKLEETVLEETVPVVIVTRDPDYSNGYAVFGGEVDTHDIDFGALDLNDAEEFADWRDSHLEAAKSFRAAGQTEAANYIEATVAETADNFGHTEERTR